MRAQGGWEAARRARRRQRRKAAAQPPAKPARRPGPPTFSMTGSLVGAFSQAKASRSSASSSPSARSPQAATAAPTASSHSRAPASEGWQGKRLADTAQLLTCSVRPGEAQRAGQPSLTAFRHKRGSPPGRGQQISGSACAHRSTKSMHN